MRGTMRIIVGIMIAVVLFSMAALPDAHAQSPKKMVVGSKEFTENRILGHILIALLEKNGFQVEDKTGLGGTGVARQALVNKQIDMYPEYTGTGLLVFLKRKEALSDPQKCYDEVKKEDLEKNGLVWLSYMNFSNNYCLMMRNEDAKKLNIQSLSDLSKFVKDNPDKISFGLNAEFYARADGYRPLQETYGFKFPEDKIIKMDPGLLYKALKDGQVNVAMGFSTDGRIRGFDLVILKDDKGYFPAYNACPVVRKDSVDQFPELEKIFVELGKKLDSPTITNLNYQVDIEHKNVKDTARDWLKTVGLL